jgi:hypothetical protein
MTYTFNIVGVTPGRDFLGAKSAILQQPQVIGVQYIPSYHCTLEALMESVDTIAWQNNWNRFEVLDAVVEFWMQNVDVVRHWKRKLYWADQDTLLISRIAELKALRTEFELLLAQP